MDPVSSWKSVTHPFIPQIFRRPQSVPSTDEKASKGPVLKGLTFLWGLWAKNNSLGPTCFSPSSPAFKTSSSSTFPEKPPLLTPALGDWLVPEHCLSSAQTPHSLLGTPEAPNEQGPAFHSSWFPDGPQVKCLVADSADLPLPSQLEETNQ